MIDGLKKVLATWAFFALVSGLLLVWLWPSPGWEHFLFVSVATLLFRFSSTLRRWAQAFFERLKKLAKRWGKGRCGSSSRGQAAKPASAISGIESTGTPGTLRAALRCGSVQEGQFDHLVGERDELHKGLYFALHQ